VKKEAQRQHLADEPPRTTLALGGTRYTQTSHQIELTTATGEELGTYREAADEESVKSKKRSEGQVFSRSRGEEVPTAVAEPRSARQSRKSGSHVSSGSPSSSQGVADIQQHSVVPLWLSGVPSLQGSGSNLFEGTPHISFEVQPRSNMDSSSSASKTSAVTSDNVSTLKGGGVKKDKALSWEKLRFRRVSKIPSHDEKSRGVRSKLVFEPLQVKFKDVGGLRTILQDFIDECEKSRPNKDSYQAIETLSNKINNWKPGHRLASITSRDFDLDVTHCKTSNEAVIQRTIMISIIDRWQLHELFVFNCEGQWKLNPIHLLPTTGRMHGVTLPKPDLAIFFKLSALTGASAWAPYPSEISHCLRPDGGDERCFPFFFIEVKKAAGDLESAFRANLHSASQALYNIYIWMSQAQQEVVFFDRVRVFTMDLNVQEINLRMHRAVSDEQNCLSFHFDDIVSLKSYDRDQACQIVRNILVEYVGKELHGILQTAFEEVSRQEQMLGQVEASHHQSKRKAELIAGQSSKRSRSRVGSEARALLGPTTSDAASSFGASGLSLIVDTQ
jgi:hypothetical protein